MYKKYQSNNREGLSSFIDYCQKGHKDIHKYTEEAFRYARQDGYKDTAEWLYNIAKTDNNTEIDIK